MLLHRFRLLGDGRFVYHIGHQQDLLLHLIDKRRINTYLRYALLTSRQGYDIRILRLRLLDLIQLIFDK